MNYGINLSYFKYVFIPNTMNLLTYAKRKNKIHAKFLVSINFFSQALNNLLFDINVKYKSSTY